MRGVFVGFVLVVLGTCCGLAADNKAVDREIDINLKVPFGAYSIVIEGVYEKGNDLIVISRLTRSQEVTAEDVEVVTCKLKVKSAARNEKHYVWGKHFNWSNGDRYTPVGDKDKLAEILKGARQIYKKPVTEKAIEGKARDICVTLRVPSSGWSVAIEKVYEKDDTLIVISRLKRPGIAKAVIRNVSCKVSLKTDAKKEKHYVLGKTYNWTPEGNYNFVSDSSGYAKEISGAALVYAPPSPDGAKGKQKLYYPNYLKLIFDDGLSVDDKTKLTKSLEEKFTGTEYINSKKPGSNSSCVTLPKELEQDRAIKEFSKTEGIKSVEKYALPAPNSYADKELIVNFKEGTPMDQRKKVIGMIKGVKVLSTYSIIPAIAVKLPDEVSLVEGMKIYIYAPNVRLVELNMLGSYL